MRLREMLRLTRAPFAPTAAWDVLGATALALAAGGRSVASLGLTAWTLLALTAVFVYAAGMVLNDLVDRERDRTLAPDRPIPRGDIPVRVAVLLFVVLAAGASLLGGGPAGDARLVWAAIVFSMLYDAFAKASVAGGALTLGLARGANAAVGVLPLVLARVAPAWTLLGPLAIGLYAAAVTLWSTTEEEAAPLRRVVARVLVLLAFLLAGLLS
ncbi:MAG: UbiA family prenyltransferase, partial [Planctomycetota bacterium]